MIPGIPDAALTPLGAVAFVLVVLILVVAFGLFVPRWIYRNVIAQKDSQIAFLLKLRETDDARFAVMEATVNDSKAVGETLLKIVNALPVPHNEDKAGGGS